MMPSLPVLGRLLGTPMDRLRKVVQVRGPALMGLFAAAYAYDWADTTWEKLKVRLTSPRAARGDGSLDAGKGHEATELTEELAGVELQPGGKASFARGDHDLDLLGRSDAQLAVEG